MQPQPITDTLPAKVSLVCPVCGTLFWRFASQSVTRSGKLPCCSRHCARRFAARPLATRFWRHVLKTDTCWLWQGQRDHEGYGLIWMRRETTGKQGGFLAHRVSWMVNVGPLDASVCVLHRCDNPACVNPDHLFLGSQVDNIRDMTAKGRVACGSRKSCARLTEAGVRAIRALAAAGPVDHHALAAAYGCHERTIRAVLNGESWRQVK